MASQNSIEPDDLVTGVQKELMLTAPNTVSSEDDNELAEAIAASPNAIGYFGYAYYQDRVDELRPLAVNGVVPTADSVDSNEYGLARPLFLYSTAEIMQEKPEVAAFLNLYLDRVNQEIEDVGYFPLDDQALNATMLTWMNAMGIDTSDAEVSFVSWLNPQFIFNPQSADPERAGVRTAILGSLWTILITILFAFPLGVGAAIYLEEYAVDNRINRLIQTNINNLAGVPSIIYGILGLAVFVRMLEALTSGKIFGLVDLTKVPAHLPEETSILL